jgi:phage portal protein BeeE
MPNFLNRLYSKGRDALRRGTEAVVLRLLAPRKLDLGSILGEQVDRESLVRRMVGYVFVCVTINSEAAAVVPRRLYSTAKRERLRAFEVRPLARENVERLARRALGRAGQQLRAAIDRGNGVHEIVNGHPWLSLMREPNGILEWTNVIELTAMYGQLVGDAHWYIVRNALNIPTQIWPLPSHRMVLARRPDQPIAGWLFRDGATSMVFPEEAREGKAVRQLPTVNGKDLLIPPEDIVHFRRIVNPLNPYGEGLSAVWAGRLAIDLQTMMEEYQRSLIEADGTPTVYAKSKERRAQGWEAEWLEHWKEMRRIAGPGVPAVVGSDVDFQVVGLSPKDLAYERGMDAMVRELAAVLRVPMPLIDTRNVSYAGAQAAFYQHQKMTVQPMNAKIDAEINGSIIWPTFGPDLFVAADDSIPDDEEALWKHTQMGVSGGLISPNEGRQRLGFETIDAPSADKLWIQSGMRPLDQLVGAPVGQAGFTALGDSSATRAVDPADPFGPQSARELDRTTWRYIQEAVYRGVEAGAGVLAEAGSLNIPDVERPEIAEFLKGHRAMLSQKVWPRINDETRKAVSAIISNAMEEGATLEQTAQRINAVFDYATEYRSLQAARTETTRALNRGEELAYGTSGEVEKKQWAASADSCPECKALDGQTAAIGEAFKGGYMTPPDPHPNCTCAIKPVLTGRGTFHAAHKRQGEGESKIERQIANALRGVFQSQRAAVLEQLEKNNWFKEKHFA